MNNLRKIEMRKFLNNIKNSLLAIVVMSFSLSLFFILLVNIFVVDRSYDKYLEEHNADDLQITLRQEIDITALTGQMLVQICKDLDILRDCIATNWDDPSDINYLNEIVNQKLKEDKQYHMEILERVRRFVVSSTSDIEINIRYVYNYDVGDYRYDLMNVTDIDSPNIGQLDAGEIAISKDFADTNGYLIGDKIEIEGKYYVIKYLTELPDYIIRTRRATTTDDYYTYILMNDNDLFDIESDFTVTYLVKGDVSELIEYGKNFGDISEVSDHKLYRLIEVFKPRELNYKMSMIDLIISNVNIVLAIIGTILFIFALVQTEYHFTNEISKDEGQIYTLKALGYRRKELQNPYLLSNIAYYSVIFIITIIVSLILMSIFNTIIFNNFAVKDIYYRFSIISFIILVSTVLLIATRARIKTLDKVFSNGNDNIVKIKKEKRSFILKRSSKLVVFNITQTLALTIVLVVSISAVFTISNSIDRIDDSFDYDRAVFFNDYFDDPNGHVYLKTYITEVNGSILDSNIKIDTIGFNENDEKEIYSTSNNIITNKLNEGVIITSFSSEVYGIDLYDEITITYRDSIYTTKVVGISNEYTKSHMYISDDILKNMAGLDENQSNFLYVDYDYVGYDRVIFDRELIVNSANLASMISNRVIFVLCILMVFTSSLMFIRLINIIFDSNKREIKILSILGYRKSEISRMQLRPYIVDSLIVFLIALVPSYLIFSYISHMFTKLYGIYMLNTNILIPYMITLCIFILLYIINALVLYKSFNKIEVYER